MREFNLREIGGLLAGSRIINSAEPEKTVFHSLGSLESGKGKFLSFAAGKGNLKSAKASGAAALIISPDLEKEISVPAVVAENVELALSMVLSYMYPPKKPEGKIESTSAVHSSAKIGKGTYLGHFVSVGENSTVGENCIIEDGVKIGMNVHIGDNARIGMNCVFHDDTVIGKNFTVFGNSTFGGDGFRFVTVKGIHHKIPQIGKVVVGDDVEIGSNCCVDRGGLEDTVIGNGCKFDNQVHVGHNVRIGNNVIIAGQSGVAGSTVIGNNVLIGGACAVSDHLVVPDDSIIAGGTGMRTSPKEKGIYIGWDWGMTYPEFQKARVNIKHLIGFNKWASRIKAIEKQLGIKAEE